MRHARNLAVFGLAAALVGADGALYVSDDKAGYIYRIAAEGP